MKRKGFTLIELLAVIVILAIIALIATPIVIHIINDTKKSSEKESIKLYLDTVTKAIVKQNLKSKYEPDICTIQSTGDLMCQKNDEDLIVEGTNKILKIEMKGEKPTHGTILFYNGKIVKYKNIKLGNLYYHKDLEGNETVTSNPLSTICKTENAISTELGTKYECDVNDEKTYIFYVLSKEDYNINLIMNNNICSNGNVATSSDKCTSMWHTCDSRYGTCYSKYGPTSVMQKLYAGTKNWTNIPDIIMDYTDENVLNNDGYIGIKTENKVTTIYGKNGATNKVIGNTEQPLKARIPKLSEVFSKTVGCLEYRMGTCPVWLVENLHYYNATSNIGYDKYEINKNMGKNDIYGYWLLSSRNSIDAYTLSYSGEISSDVLYQHGNSGIRPVITLTIDELGIK